MTTKSSFDLYLNTAPTGIIKAAEFVVLEDQGRVIKVGFRYLPAYLEHPNRFALDPVQLPCNGDEKVFNCQGGLPAFLDDYLPDDWGRNVLARLAFYRDQKKFNANSVVDTLALMGGSRIGALSIVAKGQPAQFEDGSDLQLIGRAEEAAQQIDDLSLQHVKPDEMSLLYLANSGTGVGGARPKALLSEGERHYLAKFNRLHRDPYNNAQVELACLQMAREAGINIGRGSVKTSINGRDVLLLERFDIEGGYRNHLISVNGLLKDAKTQRDWGQAFRYDDIATLLRRYSVNIENDLEQLLRLMLFNRAINNTDDHERNFSLIYGNGGYQLSPAYDLVPIPIQGQYPAAGFGYQQYPPRPSEIQRYGKVFGLSKPKVVECAESVMQALSNWDMHAQKAKVSERDARFVEQYFQR